MKTTLMSQLKDYFEIDEKEVYFLFEYFDMYSAHIALSHTKKWFGDLEDVSLKEKKEVFIEKLRKLVVDICEDV
jgi:hypothetical protein